MARPRVSKPGPRLASDAGASATASGGRAVRAAWGAESGTESVAERTAETGIVRNLPRRLHLRRLARRDEAGLPRKFEQPARRHDRRRRAEGPSACVRRSCGSGAFRRPDPPSPRRRCGRRRSGRRCSRRARGSRRRRRCGRRCARTRRHDRPDTGLAERERRVLARRPAPEVAARPRGRGTRSYRPFVHERHAPVGQPRLRGRHGREGVAAV